MSRNRSGHGASCSPTYADIILSVWEQKFVHTSIYSKFWTLYARYLDDVCIFWVGSLEQLDEFIQYLNQTTTFFKFTYQVAIENVNHLDVSLHKSEQGFRSTVYRKPIFSNTYISFTSSHPFFRKKGIVKGQYVRVCPMTSLDVDYENECIKLESMFLEQGYPSELISNIRTEVAQGRKDKYIQFWVLVTVLITRKLHLYRMI